VVADSAEENAFLKALDLVRAQGCALAVIGGGTNLIVHDDGFRGVVLRYTAREISRSGLHVRFDAGAVLQTLVDFTIDHGLSGIETMTGIPGWTGGAVYGNAGAYGRAIHQSVRSVRFYDGAAVREFNNEQCQFRYRESTFKDHKNWIVLSAELDLAEGSAAALRLQADEILKVRNAKYPPTMRCAGSIFKNLLLADLPDGVRSFVPAAAVREGKVPSAYFLELAGAKGMRNGGIEVAAYHANLIYNAGGGTASEVVQVIDELKDRVRRQFGLDLEEEVQYIGFGPERG